MRVIAGLARGLKLHTRKGEKTRPTSDKVKGALFNMIGPALQDGHFLDLFAGSGAIGIEALSRGASFAVFVEEDANCVKTIHRNIENAGFTEQSRVLKLDVLKALNYLCREGYAFEYIFLDPPYRTEVIPAVFAALKDNPLLKGKGNIILEHHKKNTGWVGGGFTQSRQKFYGDTVLSFYCEEEFQ